MFSPARRSAFVILLLLLLIGLVPSACRPRDQQTAPNGPTVALVMKTLNNPFFIDMQKGAREAAARLGVNLVVQAAEREFDVEKQMQIIENLIQRKVSVLCLTPSGSREIVPAIVKANRASIPVLIVDTRIDRTALTAAGGRVETFIGSDNVEGGRIAGRYVAQRLAGKGKVAILEGVPGHETGDARLQGFREAVKEAGLEIIASQTANWERDQGFSVFQNILQSRPEVQAVFACNDLMALGATEALAAANKQSKVLVVGFDANDDARNAIRAGSMAGSVAQHPDDMGRIAVEKAVAYLRGETLAAEIPVKVELITRDNLGPAK